MADLKRLETELKLRGFSERTIKAYLYHNRKFLEFTGKSADQIGEEDVRGYMAILVADRKLAASSLTLVKAALRFYYDDVLGKSIVRVKTPKNPKQLPIVLTRDEVKRLMAGAANRKDRLLLMLLYSSGLRLSEATNLRYGDIEKSNKIGWVRRGKGAKDRMFILSDSFIKELEKQMDKDEAPKGADYIFGAGEGKPISPRNVQYIVKKAAKAAGIAKDVHPHTLRHCFATHLLEAGVGIRQIQELLGHSNLQTTQIYTKVSTDELKKIKSPLDSL
jgi:integrase/recombinase XerD